MVADFVVNPYVEHLDLVELTDDQGAFAAYYVAPVVRREVLEAGATWLPALRDVDRDRSARADREPVPNRAVLLVHGVLLQGLGLPAELVVHLALSTAALVRRGVPAWQLPAYASYNDVVAPGEIADVLVRAEDPLRPAVRWPGRAEPAQTRR